MDIKRLIIKSFGDTEYLELKPEEIFNCVSRDVANAISHITNNQFAMPYGSETNQPKAYYLKCF